MISAVVRTLALVGVIGLASPQVAAAQARQGWVGAWTASPQVQPAPLKPLKNQTVRQRVKVTLAGSQVRLVISNEYGGKPLVIGAATVARMTGDMPQAGSFVPVTFGGAPSVTAAPGAPVFSDPVALPVAAGAELAISLYLPQDTLPETWHRSTPASDTAPGVTPPAAVSGEGDFTRQAAMTGSTPSGRLFLSRVDVLAPRAAGAVVVLGTTRPDNGRWPEFLANRLGGRLAVLNASMVANPLTRPYPGGGDAGLARFDRDVLMVPGVTHVILADAINDIGQVGTKRNGAYLVDPADMPTVESLAAAYRQMAARARARGVKVIVSTLMPFSQVPFADFYSPEKERLRVAFNQWLRTSRDFDGVIDMDAMMRDPADPTRFKAGMDSANHFTPNEAGDRVIADAIDLRLFR
jgi:lysophospholipase L1-like esterase